MPRDAWILDGNYGGTLDLRLAAGDTVVLLDLPRWTCLRRTLLRTLRSRRQGRPDMAPGCPQRLNAEYVKFLWWIWTYPTRRRPGLLRRLEELPPGKRVFRLRTDREVEALVRQIAAEARRPGWRHQPHPMGPQRASSPGCAVRQRPPITACSR